MVFMVIFSTIVFMESLLLRILLIKFPKAPLWVQKVTSFVESNIILKYFIACPLLENDKAGDDEVWIKFGRIIDRILFILLAIDFKMYNGN